MDVQEISDRLEITDLITRYTRLVDTGRWDDLGEVFTPDAVLDYSAPGGPVGSLAEAIPFIANLSGFEKWQHLIGQVEIRFVEEADGVISRAHATAYFTNPMVGKGGELWEVGGYYHHELVRTPDGWRSARMVDDIVWTRGF